MNQTERRYYDRFIRPALLVGELKKSLYEAVTFKLGHNCRYTPDFLNVYPSGEIVIVEIKGGFIRDDAMVKFKSAADKYSFFSWRMMQFKNGVWKTLHDFESKKGLMSSADILG